jgi:signal transduction histidine kinase
VDVPDGLPRLSSEAELAVFRAAQEALANVIRHAEATAVTVRFRADDHTLRLTVRDNGRGLPDGVDVAAFERQGHLGLAGMRERIQALGGRVRFAGEQGMTVIVDVPVEPGRTTQ